MKQLVTQAPVLAYYSPHKGFVIQCDASSRGLGAAVMHEEQPLAYASRALTDPETRYATIDKEMLAVVFAFEKWHQFVFGRHVIVRTDHESLEAITKKTSWQGTKAPARDAAHKLSLSHRSAIRSRPYTTPGGHDEQIIPAYGQPRHLQRVWSGQCRPNRIVFGTTSPKVREKLISKGSPLTPNKTVEIAWSLKASQAQLSAIGRASGGSQIKLHGTIAIPTFYKGKSLEYPSMSQTSQVQPS